MVHLNYYSAGDKNIYIFLGQEKLLLVVTYLV